MRKYVREIVSGVALLAFVVIMVALGVHFDDNTVITQYGVSYTAVWWAIPSVVVAATLWMIIND